VEDLWLIKTDSRGDTLWTKTYGGLGTDEPACVQQTHDDGYIITGNTASYGAGMDDLWLIKTDSRGDTLWTKTYGGLDDDQGHCVRQTSDKGYIIIGLTKSFAIDGSDVWLIKIAPDTITTNLSDNPIHRPTELSLNQNYPNPFNPSTIIEFTLPKSEFVELKVFNILGKEVSTLVSQKLNQGNHTYTFDGKNLASGVYYYRIEAGNFIETRKMIYLK